jgi:hypothetical protein
MSVGKVDNGGYGPSRCCSPLQSEWQLAHPMRKAVSEHANVAAYLSSSGLSAHAALLPNLSILLPPADPSLFGKMPKLIDYVQLPLHYWIPDWFLPQYVPFMPCPEPNCTSRTTRQRWHSGGPRLIHDVHHAVYLLCWEYRCVGHSNSSFSGWDERSLSKLPDAARSRFRYVLTHKQGVTLELHQRITDARVSGYSLHALRREMRENRHRRMYETITAYNSHCESWKKAQSGVLNRLWGGKGDEVELAELPPVLHNERGYFDHEVPNIQFFSSIFNDFCSSRSAMWAAFTQQLTGERVCFDATYKAAKRITDKQEASRLLWTLMCLRTGCILHQQMLTHERFADVLPLLIEYAKRCRRLKKALPSRVCTDRGLQDVNLIHSSSAFPDAHVNVDLWHFNQRFKKTLDQSSVLCSEVHRQFARSMYKDYTDADGKVYSTHAEPLDIITKVDALIKQYSHLGSTTKAVITKETVKWWNAQKNPIVHDRICSHPVSSEQLPDFTVSTSPLENFHRQLNRRLQVARCSKDSMHSLLMYTMFRWNVSRLRAMRDSTGKAEVRDWGTFDLLLVEGALQSSIRAFGRTSTAALWGVECCITT